MQGFEKMISGMYLGDIVRRVILRMSLESDIFGPISSKLSMPFILRFVLYPSHALSYIYIYIERERERERTKNESIIFFNYFLMQF